MMIGEKQGNELMAYWIAKNGMTAQEAQDKLDRLRGVKSVWVGRQSYLDEYNNTQYNN